MATVSFGNNGYAYYGKSSSILFETGKTHEELFDYVSHDMSQLPWALEKYVTKKMDLNSFELSNHTYTDSDIEEKRNIPAFAPLL